MLKLLLMKKKILQFMEFIQSELKATPPLFYHFLKNVRQYISLKIESTLLNMLYRVRQGKKQT